MLEINKIHHGDCLELMKEIEDKSIDCIVTDPPYGIDYSAFRTQRGNLLNDKSLEWVNDFAFLCSKVLKNECHLYCFVDVEYCPEFIFAFRNNGFKIRNLLTIPRAVKGNGGDRIFQQTFEFCIFATLGSKDEGRKFNQTQILKPSLDYIKDKRYNAQEWLYRLPDNWYWTKASEHNSKNDLHPTQKNLECIKNMVELSSNENEIILDPFCGSGTTCLASYQLKRQYIGIELDEKYYKVSCERLDIERSQLRLF